MTAVVLDNTNLDGIVADARGEAPTPEAAEKPAEPAPVAAKTNGDASTHEDEAEDESGLTEQQKIDLTKKMQAAIGKKHRALKDAEEFAAEQYNNLRMERAAREKLELELAELRGKPPKVVSIEEGQPPKLEDYATETEYQNALIDWRVDQKLKAKEADEAKQREADRMSQIQADASARIAKAIELVPDFAEVTEASDLMIPGHIAGYMQESEMLAELGYHFAKNPDELVRLQKMSPAHALVAIGKIESKLTPFAPVAKAETNGAAPPKSDERPRAETPTDERPSKPRASPPIKPLNSGSAVQVEKDESEMTAQEALQAWQKKKHANLTKRQRH